MNMKHIFKVAAFAALLATGTGCSDFLDEELKSSLAPDNTYTSTYGFEVGATGLYGWTRSEFNTWGESTTSHGQACPYEALQVATDIVYCGKQQDGSLTPFEKLSYTPSTTFVTSYWNWGYGLIASANEMLEYSEKSVKWDKPTDKAYYQAVARFFRAYAYRYMVYLYGDVPYVDKIEKDFRVDYTRTPKKDVLAKMIEDLKFASATLPLDPDKVEVGKLTKWAAEHLLSEVYLMAGEYANAERAAENVITSKHFSLMKERFGSVKDRIGDPFSDMFIENNQNRTSGNKESIWVMQLEYNTTGGGGANEDWTRRAWSPRYWDGVAGMVLADSLGGRGLAQIMPFKWWIDTEGFFTKDDIRNSESNIKRNWYYNDPASPNYGKKAEITEATWKASQLYPVITKFFFGKEEDLTYTGNSKDRMRFRLAETYLLKAEACLMQNNAKGAAEAINEVRKRAHATEISESEATIDFLLDERIRELVGEELRRFTLVRTGKLVERVHKYNPYSNSMSEKHNLWPIPQTVIDSNTGAEFPQNPL